MRNESPRPPEVPASVPSLLQPCPPESNTAMTPQRSKVLARRCSGISFPDLCHSFGYISPFGHNFIFMPGSYKTYKTGTKYQSLKDLWFYFLPITGHLPTCHHMFTEILPKSGCQCSKKHYSSSQVHRLRRMKKGQAVTSLLLLPNRSFTAIGKAPPSCITASKT